jgi:hypothetical protein
VVACGADDAYMRVGDVAVCCSAALLPRVCVHALRACCVRCACAARLLSGGASCELDMGLVRCVGLSRPTAFCAGDLPSHVSGRELGDHGVSECAHGH